MTSETVSAGGRGQGWFVLPATSIWKKRLEVTGKPWRPEYKAMKELRWHEYLEQERRLPRSVLLS